MPDVVVDTLMDGVDILRRIAASTGVFGTLAQSDYLFRPFLLVILLGIVGGICGVVVNMRRNEFNVEAMVHAVFPGIVAGALFVGIRGIVPGATIAAAITVLALVFLARFSHSRGAESEAGTACVMAGLYAIGIIISLYKHDRSGQLEALMFGRLLEVTPLQFTQAVIICLLALALLLATFKQQIFVAFDPVGARATGVKLLVIDIIINATIGAVVVAGAQAIGVLLIIGLIIIPGAAARLVASTVPRMIIVAIATGGLGGSLGMIMLNFHFSRSISPQATVTMTIAACYFIALLWWIARTKLSKAV